MSYTTRSKVEQYANMDLSAVASEVNAWIASISKVIDNYVGYSFGSVSEDHYFDIPRKGDTIITERFTGVPTVVIYNADGSVFKTLVEGVGNDFVCQPYNAGYFERIILLKDPYFFDGIFDDEDETHLTQKRIKVTATFGNGSTVPEDIELVATMMVAHVAEKRTKGGTPSSETLGDYSITFRNIEDADNIGSIKAILDSYIDIAV